MSLLLSHDCFGAQTRLNWLRQSLNVVNIFHLREDAAPTQCWCPMLSAPTWCLMLSVLRGWDNMSGVIVPVLMVWLCRCWWCDCAGVDGEGNRDVSHLHCFCLFQVHQLVSDCTAAWRGVAWLVSSLWCWRDRHRGYRSRDWPLTDWRRRRRWWRRWRRHSAALCDHTMTSNEPCSLCCCQRMDEPADLPCCCDCEAVDNLCDR